MASKDNYCVIMAGGAGTRFWPISRAVMPKQFIDPFGTGRTLIQQTFDRFKKIIPLENIFVVTNASYKDVVKQQLPELTFEQILLEPARRNTAPCIAWASYHIKAINNDANIVVAPSDHLILKEAEFLDSISKGLEFVSSSENLLTLGIKPNRPETGYGYIQVKDKKCGDFCEVKTFTEKPELDLARMFVESGEFYWNSGIFMWNVNTIIAEIDLRLPELSAMLYGNNKHVYGTDDELKFIEQNFACCQSVSIDYGVMEKADNVFVSLGDFGWSDLGTWQSLYELSEKDKKQNVVLRGKAKVYDSNNNMIVLPEGRIAVIDGLDGYLVAESDNVLLICKKEEESKIRKYVADVQQDYGDEFV